MRADNRVKTLKPANTGSHTHLQLNPDSLLHPILILGTTKGIFLPAQRHGSPTIQLIKRPSKDLAQTPSTQTNNTPNPESFTFTSQRRSCLKTKHCFLVGQQQQCSIPPRLFLEAICLSVYYKLAWSLALLRLSNFSWAN